jgi:gluconate 2-dehydrogenase gamma chain
MEALRRLYVEGVQEIDRRSDARYRRDFCRLEADGQDAVLASFEAELPSERGWQTPVVEDGLPFFRVLVLHTRQGFYADPVYGGNRGHIGWRVIGFPGPASLAEAQAGKHTTVAYLQEEID